MGCIISKRLIVENTFYRTNPITLYTNYILILSKHFIDNLAAQAAPAGLIGLPALNGSSTLPHGSSGHGLKGPAHINFRELVEMRCYKES